MSRHFFTKSFLVARKSCSDAESPRRSSKEDSPNSVLFCQKMLEADGARTLLDNVSGTENVSGSEQEEALAQQTEVKDETKAVHRHHNEGAGEFQVGESCQRETGAGVISLQKGNSSNLGRIQHRTKQRWSCRINEQGSDGEDVSQEDLQHQAVIESKNMTANQ